MALHTKGSTIYEPTSQYGDLNILWKCLYRSTFLYIIIAQCSCRSVAKLSGLRHWSCEPQIQSSNLPEAFVKSYWTNFLKVIFLPKNDLSFAFCTFISVICFLIFHHQTILSWFKKLYPGVMSHLNDLEIQNCLLCTRKIIEFVKDWVGGWWIHVNLKGYLKHKNYS